MLFNIAVVIALASQAHGLPNMASHTLQARQANNAPAAAPAPAPEGASQTFASLNQQRELERVSNQLYDLVVNMGANLERVTDLAASASDVKTSTQNVLGMIPQLSELRNSLLASVNNQPEDLKSALKSANEAESNMGRALKDIGGAAEDANILKKNFVDLGNSFKAITGASDSLFTALFPELKEQHPAPEAAPAHEAHNSGNTSAPQAPPAEPQVATPAPQAAPSPANLAVEPEVIKQVAPATQAPNAEVAPAQIASQAEAPAAAAGAPQSLVALPSNVEFPSN